MTADEHHGTPARRIYVMPDVPGAVVTALSGAGTPVAPFDAATALAGEGASCAVLWSGPAGGIAAALRAGEDPVAVVRDWLGQARDLLAFARRNRRRLLLVDIRLLGPRAAPAERDALRARLDLPALPDPLPDPDPGVAALLAELAVPRIGEVRACLDELQAASLTPVEDGISLDDLARAGAGFAHIRALADRLPALEAERDGALGRVRDADAAQAALQARIVQAETDGAGLRAEIADLRGKLAAAEAEAAAGRTAAVERDGALDRIRDEDAVHAALQAHIVQVETDEAGLARALAGSETAAAGLRAEIADLRRRLETAGAADRALAEENALLLEQLRLQDGELGEEQTARLGEARARRAEQDRHLAETGDAERILARTLADLRTEAQERLAAQAREAGIQARLDAALAETADLALVRRQLAQMMHEVTRLSGVVDDQRGELAAAGQQIARLDQDRAALQAQASDLMASHSWKMTRPLRAARTLLAPSEKPPGKKG